MPSPFAEDGRMRPQSGKSPSRPARSSTSIRGGSQLAASDFGVLSALLMSGCRGESIIDSYLPPSGIKRYTFIWPLCSRCSKGKFRQGSNLIDLSSAKICAAFHPVMGINVGDCSQRRLKRRAARIRASNRNIAGVLKRRRCRFARRRSSSNAPHLCSAHNQAST